VLLLSDIASTGFSASESAHLRLGDMVAVFAQGSIGLCATLGAKLKGAGLIIAVEADPGKGQTLHRFEWRKNLHPTSCETITRVLAEFRKSKTAELRGPIHKKLQSGWWLIVNATI